jgi:hypothetical protein
MLKILGEHYFIDLDAIEEYINVEPPVENTGFTENHISVVKYEMVKMLTDTILTENDELDETLGAKTSGLSLPFKIAFNSLLNKKLINKY